MYVPEHFKVADDAEIYAFIEANAFGQLISIEDNRPCVSHLPFLLAEDRRTLACHLARQNGQWQDLAQQQVLITFLGAHDYISPSWYQNAGVPTWNYQAVHVYGHCRVFDDAEQMADLVERLSARYEAAFDKPWQPQYSKAMLQAIVGVEIVIDEIEAKYKLSQNRPVADHAGVIEKLDELGSNALAGEMRKVLP